MEFYVSEETDQEVSVEMFAKWWEEIARCFVDDNIDKGKQSYLANYHQEFIAFILSSWFLVILVSFSNQSPQKENSQQRSIYCPTKFTIA